MKGTTTMFFRISHQLPSKLSDLFLSFAVLCSALLIATTAIAEEVFVKIDEAHILRLQSPVSQIILGNPSIADVAVQNNKMLVLTGKSFGFTNLIVLDADNNEILNKKISVTKDSNRVVTVYKGATHYSLHCTPVCEQPLVIGDNPDHFEALNKEMGTKFSIASGQSQKGAQ